MQWNRCFFFFFSSLELTWQQQWHAAISVDISNKRDVSAQKVPLYHVYNWGLSFGAPSHCHGCRCFGCCLNVLSSAPWRLSLNWKLLRLTLISLRYSYFHEAASDSSKTLRGPPSPRDTTVKCFRTYNPRTIKYSTETWNLMSWSVNNNGNNASRSDDSSWQAKCCWLLVLD